MCGGEGGNVTKRFNIHRRKISLKFNSWLKTDLPWSKIQTIIAGPQEGYYYLIVVNSFWKCREVHRCKKETTEITITFLHELFARFGVMDTLVSDNRSQFTIGEYSDFYETYQIEHITIPPYHLRSNIHAERFAYTLKRALIKGRTTPTKIALQQFLQVYRITPNNKTSASHSPPRWCSLVRYGPFTTNYSRNRRSLEERASYPQNDLIPDIVFFRISKDNKPIWEMGMVEKRIGNMVW